MEISNEQVNKIIELANKTGEMSLDNITQKDITKALIEIERKLNFFDVNVNFKVTDKNILIVDDLELSLYQLNQLMKKIGIRAFVARNPQEAKAEIIRHNFNFLLVDLFLPDSSDGINLLEELIKLKKEGKQNYKIIVISGSDDKNLIDKCYKLGVDGFVTKTENWHTDILKYLNTNEEHIENKVFHKDLIEEDIAFYYLKKFNDNKIFDELMADINSSVLNGQHNIMLNLEKVSVFDIDNTYIFAEIYKLCQNSDGSFLLINPSEKIKEGLASAYLEGVIPCFMSIEQAKNYISDLKDNKK